MCLSTLNHSGPPNLFMIISKIFIFFVIFHLLNTFGEKFSRENVTNAFTGMWLSTLALIPMGIFLTYKAMRDSQLFNNEAYFRIFKRVKKFVQNFSAQKKINSDNYESTT